MALDEDLDHVTDDDSEGEENEGDEENDDDG
jgi:hypothetical protein